MQNTSELDGLTFVAMLRQGAVSLGKDKTVINDLNVFPIPDGDTGDNMLMTLKAGCAALEGHLGALSELSSAASSGMLLGARGNSGVILSRIFSGLAKGLKDVVVADPKTFAKAMQSSVEEAYKSVPVPVEGTIITVLREGVAGADAGSDLNHYFETLLNAMQVSLDHTPELLQVLKEAGVVDSGGAGLVSIFRGMNEALTGIVSEEGIVPSMAASPTVELDKFTENSTLEFGYCTEFLLRLMRSKVDLDAFDEKIIFDYLNQVGESVVAFREDSIVKVHVHTFTPGVILNEMQKYGEFLTIKIENMALQHHQSTNQNNASFKLPSKPYGIVTVASGEGLINAFREFGVDEVIAGGQTMNPSTQDFFASTRNTSSSSPITIISRWLPTRPPNFIKTLTSVCFLRLPSVKDIMALALSTVTIPMWTRSSPVSPRSWNRLRQALYPRPFVMPKVTRLVFIRVISLDTAANRFCLPVRTVKPLQKTLSSALVRLRVM